MTSSLRIFDKHTIQLRQALKLFFNTNFSTTFNHNVTLRNKFDYYITGRNKKIFFKVFQRWYRLRGKDGNVSWIKSAPTWFQDPLISAILIMQRDIWSDMASPARAVFWAVTYPSVTPAFNSRFPPLFHSGRIKKIKKTIPPSAPFLVRPDIDSHPNNE